MKKVKAMRIITDAYNKLNSIGNDKDLRKHKLSLSDYRAACFCMRQLGTPTSSAETICENVANFFERCGFTVAPKGIGFKIYLQ